MSNSHCCLCCFKNLLPIYLSIILLVANAVAVIILIWGVAEMVWSRKYTKRVYWAGFIIFIVTLILAIIILIFTILRNKQKDEITRNIGKMICIAIIVLGIIALILTLIGTIITIVDYATINSILDDLFDDKFNIHIPKKWWATLIVPEVITFIASVIFIMCARALYIIFNERILTSISEGQTDNVNNIQENSIIINQNQTPNNSSNKFNLTTNNINLTNNNNNIPSSNVNNGIPVTPNSMINNK